MRWGRSVYANIQKFIQFQLTVNVAALIINVVAAVSAGNVPLNAVQVCDLSLSRFAPFLCLPPCTPSDLGYSESPSSPLCIMDFIFLCLLHSFFG